jgi:hypothetical protein
MSIARHALVRIAPQAALWVIIALACAMSVSTYSVFGHTWDEPEHIAAGMVLIDKGEYPYDAQHPPLARIAMAIGPYLAGAHSYGNPGPSGEQEGRDILYRDGHYDKFLTLARIGMLPFLVLLLISTWLWTRYSFGTPAALLATSLTATTPVIVGHAAVAALDVPMAATTMLAMYLMVRWFDDPRLYRALAFGVAAGLAAGTKLSSPPFLICVAIAWTAAHYFYPRARESETTAPILRYTGKPISPAKILGHGGVAAVTALVVLVFCYGFSLTKYSPEFPITVPVGVRRLTDSLIALTGHNSGGHLSYFMGELRRTGWWNFYLIALAVKTPLPLLICAIAGSLLLLWRARVERSWIVAAPVLAGIAILLFSSAYSHINIGVRHVMVMFPLLAIIAAAFAVSMWHRFNHVAAKGVLVALVSWQAWSVVNAHPDYLAYFNELAGSHPEKILIDSDLDWGQDMRRLENELNARHITDFGLIYRGTADLPHEHLPHYRRLWPKDRATGWIAVSLLAKATAEDDGRYSWLDAYQPVTRVGKSIDLYYIAP